VHSIGEQCALPTDSTRNDRSEDVRMDTNSAGNLQQQSQPSSTTIGAQTNLDLFLGIEVHVGT
jgi:hypothetical protein